jgi:hypothetical protein
MIPISEVLEEAAQTVEGFDACDPKHIAAAIRALIPKYEGCIVAEGPAIAWGVRNSRITERNPLMQSFIYKPQSQYPELLVPLYRAKEPK